MAFIKADVEWHVIAHDPYDLPGPHETVLTTSESTDGDIRETRCDIYLTYTDDANATWCICVDGEDTIFWRPVVAWAYLPEPYTV